MLVSANRLAMGGSTSNAFSYNTSSITPSIGRPIIIQVLGKGTKEASVSGCGLTFTKKKFIPAADGLGTLTVLEGLGDSPSSGALTIYFGGEIQSASEWVVVELVGADSTGGSSIRQVSGGHIGTSSSYTCPALASFGSISNATIGCFSNESGSGITLNPGSGFSEIGETGFYENNNSMFEFKNSNDTTVDTSRVSGTGTISGIALEVIASITSFSPSISPSVSPSVSPSKSPSSSPSVSPSVSVSPSLSPSRSPSNSPSLSLSVSPSASISPSLSPSPSPGWQDYTKGNYAVLPTNDGDLENTYSGAEYLAVQTYDGNTVSQDATGEYAVHQFREYVGGAQEMTLTWKGQSNTDCFASTTYLQIFNRNTNSWETLDSNNLTPMNVDFTLTAQVLNLTNYLYTNDTVLCRVYQLGV